MKHFSPQNARWYFIAIISLVLFKPVSALAQLSGTYTIGGSGADYANFTDAVSDLTKNGVNGAVVFNVSDSAFSEQVSIGNITGASATNTITFQSASGDSSKAVLTSASSSSSTTNYTLELNKARYITIKNLTISRTGTDAYGIDVALTGNTFNCKFIGNLLIGEVVMSTTSLYLTAGQATINSTGADSGNVYSGNHIKNGFNSFAFTGTSYGYKNIIQNNICDTPGHAGVYATNYQVNLLIKGNTINCGPFTTSGHYLSYGARIENAINLSILKNRFFSTSNASVCRCINLVSSTITSGSRNIVANNFIWVSAGSSSSTGIALYGNSDIDIAYNNVLMTSTPTSGTALYFYPTSAYTGKNTSVVNNNLINLGGGTAIDNGGGASVSGVTSEDNNNLYVKGTYVGNFNGSSYKILSDWLATGFDSASLSVDPGYASNMDLHVSSAAINNKGIPLASVTDDIDGDTRNSTTPDIGADEFTPLSTDAGVTSLDSPKVFCTPATINIVTKLTNFGTDTLKSLQINWSIDGVIQTPYSWTGSIALGEISSQINIGSYAFLTGGNYKIKIWTSDPNSTSDQKNSNDTLSKTIGSGLSGTYTLGGLSPDFESFNDALDAITLRGLCGPTVFNVRNGNYNEQLTILDNSYSSASNTVTFQSESGDSSKVILSYGASSANGNNTFAVQLKGARFFTFKNMTIQRTGTGIYEGVIEMKGNADNNAFINDRIIGIVLSGANTNADLVQSIADKDTSNTFRNCLLRFGNAGINLSGDAKNHENNNVILGNTFDSCYTTAVSATYNDGILVRKNTIVNCNFGKGAYYGIQLNTCDSSIAIRANKVIMKYGGTAGIYLLSCTAASGSESLISNNFVSLAAASTSPAGIYLNSGSYVNVYFNTVLITNSNSGSAFYAGSGYKNINILNNILDNKGGGYAIKILAASSISTTDYNDLYTTGKNLAYWDGKDVSDLSAWQSATSQAANSVSERPYFVSPTDYHTYNTNLSDIGTPISGIDHDIDGNVRSTTAPSVGAVEIVHATNDAGISAITSPSLSICPGSSIVEVTLSNAGIASLTSANIGWSVNGTAQTGVSYSGSAIAPTGTATVSLGLFNFSSGSAIIKVWSSLPNGQVDSFPGNDTFSVTITVNSLPAASVITNTSICQGSSVNIGGKAVTGSSYGWVSNPPGFTSISADPSVAPTVATTYTLTETNASGCIASNSVTISLKSSPAAYVGTPATVCSGNTIQIGGTAVSGNTYSWSSNPSGFISSAANPFVTPTTTTTYTLVETQSGCSTSNVVTITANPKPTANAGSNVSICNGSSTTIGTSAVSGNSYYWTTLSSSYTSTASNPSVNPGTTTTYILQETIDATGCSNLGAVVVTVNPLPSAFAGSNVSICDGNSTQIGGTSVSGNSYSWSSSPSGFFSTSANAVVSPTATTDYTLTETTSAGCSQNNTVTITVNPLPASKIVSSVTSACNGSTVAITITSTGSGYSYKWYKDGGLINGATSASYFTSTSGNFTAMVTNTNGCSAMSNSISITINPMPVASANAFGSTSSCLGDSVMLIANTASGYSYQWSKDGSDISGATSYSYAATQSGNYQVKVTNASGCSDTASTIPVFFNTPPTAPITGGSGAICEGQSVVIRTNTLSDVSYTWYINNLPISGATSSSYAANTSGKYNVTVKSNSSGCSTTSSTVSVVVNPVPVAIIKVLGNSGLCAGSSVILSADKNTGYSYQWIKDGAYIGGDYDTLIANAAGTYNLVVTNSSGCNANAAAVTITTNTPATISIDQPAKTGFCKGGSLVLHTTGSSNIVSYVWMLNGNTISGANSDSIVADQNGKYTVMVTSQEGCNTSDNIIITVNEAPVSIFGKPSYKVCTNASVAFINKSYIVSGTLSYIWVFGNGDSSTAENPVYAYPAAGKYKVSLWAVSGSGCSTVSVDSIEVLNTNVSTFTAVHIGNRRMAMTPADLTGTTYDWNFGDNTLGSGQSPVHQYATDGSYQVSLTVTNASGCSTTTVSTVKVDATGVDPLVMGNFIIKIFPNPFKTSTNVVYNLNESATVSMEAYDMLGKRVANIPQTIQQSGEHNLIFNGEKPGTYFIKLIVNGQPFVSKVIQQ